MESGTRRTRKVEAEPIGAPPPSLAAVEAGASPPLPIGHLLAGRYAIRRLLARGGMAEVYEAVRIEDGRSVAIKRFFHDAGAGGEESRRRARREAHIGALSLPGVPALLDHEAARAGEHAGFLVLQLIEGVTLVAARRSGSFGRRELLDAAMQVAGTLAAAHARGIFHRDVKPENILLDRRGGAWLLDFGIAFLDGEPALTAAHTVLGTLPFIAPEHLLGSERPDGRTDVYGLGATLFECLASRPLLEAADLAAARRELSRREHAAPRFATLRPDLPSAVCDLVDRATALRREDRFPTIEAMREAIRAAMRPEIGEVHKARVRAASRIAALLGLILVVALIGRALTPLPPVEMARDAAPTGDRATLAPPEETAARPPPATTQPNARAKPKRARPRPSMAAAPAGVSPPPMGEPLAPLSDRISAEPILRALKGTSP